MTDFDPTLKSTIEQSLPASEGVQPSFVRPWRVVTRGNGATPQQPDVHTCSCGCGCDKGLKLANDIREDLGELIKELKQVKKEYAQMMAQVGKKPKARKTLRKARKK